VKGVAPTEHVRKEVEELPYGVAAAGEEGSIGGRFIRLAIQRVVQEILEAERSQSLHRGPYERTPGAEGWRNGYEPRALRTTEGRVPIDVPQVRGTPSPFKSELVGALGARAEVLERLAVEMHARGLSTRDIGDHPDYYPANYRGHQEATPGRTPPRPGRGPAKAEWLEPGTREVPEAAGARRAAA